MCSDIHGAIGRPSMGETERFWGGKLDGPVIDHGFLRRSLRSEVYPIAVCLACFEQDVSPLYLPGFQGYVSKIIQPEECAAPCRHYKILVPMLRFGVRVDVVVDAIS